jgi:transcriptional regulator of arginine metabolism
VCPYNGRSTSDERRVLLNREHRHRRILELIAERSIHNQRELGDLLGREGIDATQATLSRDLKILGVARRFDRKEGYIYTHGPDNGHDEPVVMSFSISDITGVTFSGNLAVIKTKLGHALGVAFEIDRLNIPEVVGTVGGDDTLLVVLKEGTDRSSFMEKLHLSTL